MAFIQVFENENPKSNNYLKQILNPTEKIFVQNMETKSIGLLKDSKGTIEKGKALQAAILSLQRIANLQSQVNTILGPLLFLDFAVLFIMTCALGFLPIKFSESYKDNPMALVVYGSHFAVYSARLFIIVLSLGNIFPAGIDVNIALAGTLISSCSSSQNESSNAASILAYLSVYSANPICFTAWGFFPITRNTLLATFSIISTYVIIVLQMSGTS